ncbi:MAG: tetratricopeptide repeat protein [Bacteroidales bacterium]|nr:tetratricopeptide repeat protein [Bacteroidales bacterium]
MAAILYALLPSCASKKQHDADLINKLENELFSGTHAPVDIEKLLQLVDAYVSFADKNPDDTLAAEYLFRAADIAMNIGYSERSIELLSRIQQQYADFKKVPETFFLMGFVYENNLNDLEKAREMYSAFIESYPDHELADDATVLLQYLGRSPEEMIREFEKKQQAIQ